MKNTKEDTLFGDTGCVTHYASLVILAGTEDNLPIAFYNLGRRCIHVHSLAYRGLLMF